MRESEAARPVALSSPPVALSSPLEDEDLLQEILLRLPPQPSSLPRASAVCKRWRGLVTDPKFQARFRAIHQKPPLLGVFGCDGGGNKITFRSILDPPDHIPSERFDLVCCSDYNENNVLDCRHGRVLFKDWVRNDLVVFAPITGEQRRVAIPAEFRHRYLTGAVLCAASDQHHVHGGCHLSPFKVILMPLGGENVISGALVYSSETGIWGNLIFTATPCELYESDPATLVGNALYWPLVFMRDDILEFDLEEQSLALIKGPHVTNCIDNRTRQIVQAENGVVGLGILTYPRFQMWQRDVNCHGVATWVLHKTTDMHSILGLPPHLEGETGGMETILGYSDDTDVIFLYVDIDVYMVHLKSMQSKILRGACHNFRYYPFTSFYAPGTTIKGGSRGAKMLHDT